MRWHLGGFLWLLMSVICTAAEIVAWKVPLNYFAWNGLETKGIVRCEAAPEASPFFKEGDELWALKDVSVNRRIETAPSLEWAIWNASSRTLVTKSDWNGIWHLHRQLRMDRLPKRCRLILEVFDVPSDGSPLSDTISPLAVLSWVVRPGMKFEASHQLEDKAIVANGSSVIGENSDLVELVLKTSCVLPNQPRLDLATSITLRSGDPMWIARDYDGNKGLDLRLTGSIELVDGTPSSEAIRIQKGQMIKCCGMITQDRNVIVLATWVG